MDKLDYVIDVQAFHDKDGEFLPKEIAVIALDFNFISHWIIKPPYTYDKLPKGIMSTNSYLSAFHHQLEWEDGESSLEDVYSALRKIVSGAQNIYVRGVQKAKLLERMLGRQICNLEDYNCPTFKNLPQVEDHFCFHHGRKIEFYSCAVTYAYKLRVWLRKTLNTENFSNSADRKPKHKTVKVTALTENFKKLNISTSSKEKSGGIEPLYSTPHDEHKPDLSSASLATSANGGRVPGRQNSESVDETGRYRNEH